MGRNNLMGHALKFIIEFLYTFLFLSLAFVFNLFLIRQLDEKVIMPVNVSNPNIARYLVAGYQWSRETDI